MIVLRGCQMNKAILSAISAVAISISVSGLHAADMPMKSPPAPMAPSWTWTGFYVGGNLGYSWGKTQSVSTLTDFDFFTTIQHSDAQRLSGVVDGGQAGYNWQMPNRWLIGLEADWQGTSEHGSQHYSDLHSLFVGFGTATTDFSTRILWLGTVRGRIGYTFDRVLVYATGGYAYGDVKLSGTVNDAGSSVIGGQLGPFSSATGFGGSHGNSGWTAGGGIVGILAPQWTWKVEYLYVDLGSLNVVAPGPFLPFTTTDTISIHSRFADNIIRAGLNLHFP